MRLPHNRYTQSTPPFTTNPPPHPTLPPTPQGNVQQLLHTASPLTPDTSALLLHIATQHPGHVQSTLATALTMHMGRPLTYNHVGVVVQGNTTRLVLLPVASETEGRGNMVGRGHMVGTPPLEEVDAIAVGETPAAGTTRHPWSNPSTVGQHDQHQGEPRALSSAPVVYRRHPRQHPPPHPPTAPPAPPPPHHACRHMLCMLPPTQDNGVTHTMQQCRGLDQPLPVDVDPGLLLTMCWAGPAVVNDMVKQIHADLQQYETTHKYALRTNATHGPHATAPWPHATTPHHDHSNNTPPPLPLSAATLATRATVGIGVLAARGRGVEACRLLLAMDAVGVGVPRVAVSWALFGAVNSKGMV